MLLAEEKKKAQALTRDRGTTSNTNNTNNTNNSMNASVSMSSSNSKTLSNGRLHIQSILAHHSLKSVVHLPRVTQELFIKAMLAHPRLLPLSLTLSLYSLYIYIYIYILEIY